MIHGMFGIDADGLRVCEAESIKVILLRLRPRVLMFRVQILSAIQARRAVTSSAGAVRPRLDIIEMQRPGGPTHPDQVVAIIVSALRASCY